MMIRKGSTVIQDTIAQKRAVKSVANVASVFGLSGPIKNEEQIDPDLKALVDVLKSSSDLLSVAEVASKLGWDSDKAASMLVRASRERLLRFLKDGNLTRVELI